MPKKKKKVNKRSAKPATLFGKNPFRLGKNPFRLGNKPFNYCILGFLLPFLGMGITILIRAILMERNSTAVFSMLYSDCYHQYFPFFKALRQNLQNGESLLFFWEAGMGLDYLGLIAYYLGSPLNLLSVLLPDAWVVDYFTLLNPIRIGFAGLFFSMMLQKLFDKNDLSIAVWGSFYATCAWVMGYMWNVMWMDTFALLPLVVLGTIRLLTQRKYLLYTVALFLSVAINYYIGFFTCVFTLLVFIIYQICRWRNFRRFAVDLGLMALFTVIAIGMTAFITLPAYAQLQTTSSSVNEFPEAWSMNHYLPAKTVVAELNQKATQWVTKLQPELEAGSEQYQKWYTFFSKAFHLLEGMKQSATNNFLITKANYVASEGLPNIYCGIFANIFLFLFLTNKQTKWRERICCVVLLLFMNASFILRRLDYIWHGFHFPNMIPYRFSFLYSFVLLFVSYRAWTLRRRFRTWQVAAAIGLTVLLMLGSNAYQTAAERLQSPAVTQALQQFTLSGQGIKSVLDAVEITDMFPFVNFGFLLCYMVGLLWGTIRIPLRKGADWAQKRVWHQKLRLRRKVGTVILLCVFCLELVVSLAYYGNYLHATNLSAYPRGTEDAERIINIMKEREDELFYRTEVTHTQTYNDGALNDYYGITTFSSSANASVTNFMDAMGYAGKPNWNRYAFEEGSPVTNLFLGLKYMIERTGSLKNNPYFTDIHHSGKVHLLENNYYLPLGCLTDSSLADLDFAEPGNRFQFQNELLSAAVGSTLYPWFSLKAKDRQIASTDGVTLSNISDSTPSSCSYTAGASGGSVFYTFTFDREGYFCVRYNMPKRNGITVSYDDGSGYKTLYTEDYAIPFVMAVCQVKPGDRVQITLKCKANESGSLQLFGALLDQNVMDRAYEELSRSTLELTHFENTRIEGTIDCHKDGLLYTSIPNCGNWEVYVDGEKAEVTLIGDAMTGVMLTQGSHTVTFRYRNKAFTVGCIVSLASAAALVGIWWYTEKYLKKKTGKFSGKTPA